MNVPIRSSGHLWRKSLVSIMLLTISQITISILSLRFRDPCLQHTTAIQVLLIRHIIRLCQVPKIKYHLTW